MIRRALVALTLIPALTALDCPTVTVHEGYTTVYVDPGNQTHVRYSTDGVAWNNGSFPATTLVTDGLSGTADVSGAVYLVAARVQSGVKFWTGLGAANWQALRSDGTAPAISGTPAVAYLAPGRWLVAFSDGNHNLGVRIYNSTNEAWEDTSVPIAGSLTSGVLGDPAVVTRGNLIVVAWQHTSGLARATGTIANGSPTLRAPALLPGGELPPPRGRPFLAQDPANVYLGYVGAIPMPSPGGTIVTRDQIVVLSSADGNSWTPYAAAPNPTNTQVTLRGVAGRSDHSVLAIGEDGSGWSTRRYLPSTGRWEELNAALNPTPAEKPLALFATGRP